MTLSDTIERIKKVAMNQPAINQIVENDIYRLNGVNDAMYGVFSFVQREHTEDIDTGGRTYSFVFYYIDRLCQDQSNEVEIQSTGVDVLSNICKVLRKDFDIIDPIRYDTFNVKFNDECAGVYCNVNLMTSADTTCGECY